MFIRYKLHTSFGGRERIGKLLHVLRLILGLILATENNGDCPLSSQTNQLPIILHQDMELFLNKGILINSWTFRSLGQTAI